MGSNALAAAAIPGLLLGAFLHFSGTGLAQPVRLQLRNGDHLTGTVLGEEAGHLAFSNAILGRVRIPLAEVERRESVTNASAAIALAPPVVAAQTNATTGPAAVAEHQRNSLRAGYLAGGISAAEYQRQAAKLTNAPLSASKQVPKHLSGEAQMGTDLGFSQKERQLYTGRLKLSYVRAPVHNLLDYSFTYGRIDGELSANRMDGLLKSDNDLTPRVYLYSLAGGGYDEIRKIDWRYEVGPGLGYQLVKKTNLVLRVEGGFHFDVHNFEDNRQDDTYYHRLAQDLRWNLGTIISVDEKLEYLPQFDTFMEYKLRVEANVRLWLRSNLYLNLTMIDLFDTVTAQGVEQNDLQVRSSVGVRF